LYDYIFFEWALQVERTRRHLGFGLESRVCNARIQ